MYYLNEHSSFLRQSMVDYKLKRGKTVHNKNRFILKEACAKNDNFKFLFV